MANYVGMIINTDLTRFNRYRGLAKADFEAAIEKEAGHFVILEPCRPTWDKLIIDGVYSSDDLKVMAIKLQEQEFTVMLQTDNGEYELPTPPDWTSPPGVPVNP